MVPHDPAAPVARYSIAAIILHWLIAAIIVFQLAVGFGLEDLGAKAFAQYQLHKSVGILILLLTLLRLGIRFALPRPQPVEKGLPGTLAAAVHVGLYAFMLGAPLTGWMLVSTAKIKVPTLLFGVVPLPHLPLPDAFGPISSGAHEVMAVLGIALIVLHVLGALRHHWLLRDRLIYRMTPAASWLVTVLLVALLPLGWVAGRAMLAPSPSTAPLPKEVAAMPAPVPQENSLAAAQPLGNEVAAADVEQKVEEQSEDASGPPPAWTIQPGGRLEFTATYGSDSYRGSFADWSGDIVMDPEKPETATIKIDVDMSSVTMSDATQNTMVKGDDFFSAAQFAKAVFRSDNVRKTGTSTYQAEGTLSLKSVSAAQTLRFALSGSGERRKVTGSAEVDRLRHNIGTGPTAQGISPAVTVNFSFDATANPARNGRKK